MHYVLVNCIVHNLILFNTDNLSDEREKLTNVNRMKMTTYLFCQLVELLEADAVQVRPGLNLIKLLSAYLGA